FIEMGFKYLQNRKDRLHILEVGFGTGLNALLSLAQARESQQAINYIGIEPLPVPPELLEGLKYQEIFDSLEIRGFFATMHQSPWNQPIEINEYFHLTKVKQPLMAYESPDSVDLVYFDAFAPSKHPEMWDKEVFLHLAQMMEPGGILVTYCAKGQVKRDLQAAGFRVEKLPGPPGKREMIRAHYEGIIHPENAS
ncbi:MAG: tRNA (5-methylaminomethyl-2-thiouridine)(34)-methyltransferase MnmD, partial [Bacteroidota bacterium]